MCICPKTQDLVVMTKDGLMMLNLRTEKWGRLNSGPASLQGPLSISPNGTKIAYIAKVSRILLNGALSSILNFLNLARRKQPDLRLRYNKEQGVCAQSIQRREEPPWLAHRQFAFCRIQRDLRHLLANVHRYKHRTRWKRAILLQQYRQ